MSISLNRRLRRSLSLAVVGTLAVALTACTGRGGGQLPADGDVFKGPASFGFSFSCEDKGGLNPPTGQLRIQLSYTDHGSNISISNVIRSSFSIHGTADTIDPVLESVVCSGQQPPPPPLPENQLIFLGRYRQTSSAPAGFPPTCSATTPVCRFEVIVHDNDKKSRPLDGRLLLDQAVVDRYHPVCFVSSGPYVLGTPRRDGALRRAGTLSSGNLTVDY